MASYATVALARADARALLVAASVTVGDMPVLRFPGVMIFSNGTDDLRGMGKAGVPWTFRLVAMVKRGAAKDTIPALATLTATVLSTFRAAAGWQVVSIGPEAEGTYEATPYLANDVIVTTIVTL